MSRRIRLAITATLAAALPFAHAAAQARQLTSKEALVARVDSMARAYMAEKGPASMSIAISRGSETLVERAYGLADVATNRPASPATVYKIGSVSKQFTAVLILKQVERGRLTLTDSIGRHLTSGLRPEWRSITIEQLLNHTSGLPRDLTREGRPEEEVSAATMIAWAARDTMLFAPGTRYSYSNPGYLLLGALVEKLYDKPYREVVRDEIASPLGLRTLRWCTNPAQDSTVAKGYEYEGPGKLRQSEYAHPSKSLGGGGLCSSARDLAAWNRALHGGRVLTPASYTAMTTPRGAATGYGFGLQMGRRPAPWSAYVIYHLGGIMGFSAENAWFPAESLSVTVLYNSIGNGFPTNYLLEIARAVSTQGSSASGETSAAARTVQTRKLDSIATANIARDHTVGAVVGIVKGSDTVFLAPYGKANVEASVPMRPDAIFGVGSITKQFTAAAILQLRDQGKLTLEDDITKWLPDFDTRGERISLRQMLNHTSGIPNVMSTVPEIARLRADPNVTRDTIYRLVRKYPLQFAPGSAQMYSNTAYWLLHLVIEKASGLTYPEYLERTIFAPLAMRSTGVCHGVPDLPRRAVGYGVRNGEWRRAPENVPVNSFGSGALCSSVADMVTWLQALHGGNVLSKASYAEMTRPATLTDGTPLRYGMGLDVKKDARGNSFIGHSGELPGYAARANWYPDAQMAVVVLMNNSFDSSPTALVDALAAELLPGSHAAPKPFSGDADPLIGTYKGTTSTGATIIQVARGAEGLTISTNGAAARPIVWVEGLTFRQGGVLLTFRHAHGGSGSVAELRYDTGEEHSILART